MIIYIGENIKKMRLAKKITQEKLAEHLSISTQAVSKWERNETYPDITLLLPLARYFDISTDKLLGMDVAKDEEKIKRYLDEYYHLGAKGRVHEKFNLIREAYREFPYDFRIVEEYMWQLYYDPNNTESSGSAHKKELYALCEYVLNQCTQDHPRYSALSILGGLYLLDGKTEKALKTVERFPEYWFTQGEEKENMYSQDSDEWWKCTQENIQRLMDMLIAKIRNCALCESVPIQEQIRILEKAVALIELIYDEGDYGFNYYHLCELFIWLGNRHVILGEYETGFYLYDKALSYGKTYDELPMISKHTSFLVNRLEQDMSQICSDFKENLVARELRLFETYGIHETIKDMAGFKAVVEKFKDFSRTEKASLPPSKG